MTTISIEGSTLERCSERSIRTPCKFCGRTEGLYWAHDMARPGNKFCHKCRAPRSFVMIEADGTAHECRSGASRQVPDDADSGSDAAVAVITDAKPAKPVAGTAGNTSDAMAAFQMFIDAMGIKVDAEQVGQIVDDRLGGFRDDVLDVTGAIISEKLAALIMPTLVKVGFPDGSVRDVPGATHKVMPDILKLVSRRKHVLMVGPAGTGKSKIAHQVSQALGLDYSEISLSPDRSTSALLGYMNAVGEYVATEFRKRFELGGVMHLDELDNAHPSVLAVFNAGLANGHMAFPDGMVDRHPDFVCVASANTYGSGPDRAYVGRQAIDKATLNRFLVVPVGYDLALERVVCMGSGASETVVDAVLLWVRALRRNAESYKLPVVLGTRNAEHLCSAIDAGIRLADAIEYAVRCGMSEQDWSKVNSGVSRLSI
jgi:cobaltochelatase CobS